MFNNTLKRNRFFLSLRLATFLLLPPFIIDASEPPVTNTFVISPAFNVQPTAVAHATNNTTVVTITTAVYEKIKDTLTYDNYESVKNAISKLLWDNKYKVGLISAGTTYAILAGLLIHDYSVVNNKDSWCNWKSTISMIDLYNIDQKTLEAELIRDITTHYYDPENPTIVTQPLVTFLATIEQEIKTLNRYLSVAKAIQKARLIKIFPTNSYKIETAQRLLERTHFVKRVFLLWLAEYALHN